jgi:mono/diheme cytochrome c family protein
MLRKALLGAGAAVLFGGACLALFVYVTSERALRATYNTPVTELDIPEEPDVIARGEHLVRSVGTCTLCHGEDLGGSVYADEGAIGRIVGPNLTRGRGGVGAELTTDDWVRAIRYGVRRDGTSLLVMPSEVYTFFSDADLAAIIAYIRRAPAVDRELPRSGFGWLGRTLFSFGRLNLLVAPKTHHPGDSGTPSVAASVEYGRYLANVSGCHGCHGFGLSGGRVAGPPSLPPASNLTPSGIGHWTEGDFVRALREGRRPDGTMLDDFMPWRSFATLTDVEVSALWMYLRSVPPKATGGK